MTPEQQFNTLALALSEVDDATTRAALAQKVFGKAGTELLPLFTEGAEGMEALRQKARDLGIVMSADAAKDAADFNDAMNELKSAAMGLFMGIAGQLLPALSGFARWLVSKKPDIIAFFTAVKEGAAPFFKAFKTGLGVILPLIKSFFQFIFSNKPILIAAIAAIGAVIFTALGPVSQGAVAIAGIIVAVGFLKDNIGKLKEIWTRAWGAIKGTFDKVTSFVVDLYKGKWGWLLPGGALVKGILFLIKMFGHLRKGVVNTFKGVAGALKGALNAVIGGLNVALRTAGNLILKIKGALDKIPGPNPAGNFLLGVAERLSNGIPKLERGAKNFKGGMAMVGERGPEMVNLPRGSDVIPNRRMAASTQSTWF